MTLAKSVFSGDGDRKSYSISFDFLAPEHIKATVDGTKAPFVLTGSTLQFTSAPPLDSKVVIYRDTSRDTRLVQLTDAPLSKKSLDTALHQVFFMSQEALDGAELGLGGENTAKHYADAAAISASEALASKDATETSAAQMVEHRAAILTAQGEISTLTDHILGPSSSDLSTGYNGVALFEGLMYWNTTSKRFRVYSDGSWQDLAFGT